MNTLVADHESDLALAVEHVRAELQTIRGNRAHPSLVEDVRVPAYGSEMRLKELATISVPDPRTILVQPWDKGLLKDLERGLREASLNLGVTNDGAVVRLALPPLTEETRQALLKVLSAKCEAGRVQVRQIREKIRESIIKAERDKAISEDERYAAQDDLEEVVRRYIDEIKTLGERKHEEIMTV